ncbi:alkaline phosphatase D family protein [Polluticoccus soli]|uniref:alkaline phosphatase D family protein n=1 Tax=Polluticoccus soli TaxID=3034150 RepID=UPI0023E18E41|nr:alkaline phosphatase D family protein [Flavipsychrobacter sp. JY13-12]
MKICVHFALLLFLCAFAPSIHAQVFIAGPMAGHVSRNTANIWIEAAEDVSKMQIAYWPASDSLQRKSFDYYGELSKRFNTAVFTINELNPATTYYYEITASGSAHNGAIRNSFTTQPEREVVDFSFLTGSCAANVLDTSIFTSMANTPADFMVWLGDNWYLPNKIPRSEILWQGAYHVRSMPILQPLFRAMPHYATWDDHDYGPNDSDKDFPLKEDARRAFIDYWANPSYGQDDRGIYTSFTYGDVKFIMLDDRWWRSSDKEPAMIDGNKNKSKLMFGKEQMDWLKKELKSSDATFNIIVSGSQMLNEYTKYDCFYQFPEEYDELMNYIEKKKIEGVIFFTGDRHHSEIIRVNRRRHYPLYDVTVSPFTSNVHKVDKELNNPLRVPGTLVDQKQNYARVSVSGKAGSRKLRVEYLGLKGEKLAEWQVSEKELEYLW